MFYANFVNRAFSSISCCCCQVDKYANLCLIICSSEITKNELNVCVHSYLFPRYENRYIVAGASSSGSATATGTGIGDWRRQVALCERSKLFVLQLYAAKV